MMNYADYDLNSIIRHYECSIEWLDGHKEDVGIKDKTIKRHVATLNYLKELKELKEKIDNPTTQVIVADAYNDEYNVYRRCNANHFLVDLPAWQKPYIDHLKDLLNNQYGRLDVASMHPFTPKQKDRKIKKVEFNGPATIIFWEDDTKTVVKNYDSSEYDREKGILYAVLKKLATKKEYNDILRTIDKGRNKL